MAIKIEEEELKPQMNADERRYIRRFSDSGESPRVSPQTDSVFWSRARQ
jgi:hypothetical protein